MTMIPIRLLEDCLINQDEGIKNVLNGSESRDAARSTASIGCRTISAIPRKTRRNDYKERSRRRESAISRSGSPSSANILSKQRYLIDTVGGKSANQRRDRVVIAGLISANFI